MIRSEILARIFLTLLLVAVGLLVLFGWQRNAQAVSLHARMPESGGWTPAVLYATAGEPLHLRLTSDDVAHSFAVGKMDWPTVELLPGEMTELELIFDQPGNYTYYCTRWCGPNHWRMRGTIEVSGNGDPLIESEQALYMKLGLDLDAEHHAEVLPDQRPVPTRGVDYLALVPAQKKSSSYYRSHSPAEVWADLRAEPVLIHLADAQVWDLVAAMWQAQTTPETLQEGMDLYDQNCAACHGTLGKGDGIFASEAPADQMKLSGHKIVSPTDFTDAEHMLGASPAILQGKIIRGGMGTGMPYWGTIFTSKQTWALVDAIYSFQFSNLMKEHP